MKVRLTSLSRHKLQVSGAVCKLRMHCMPWHLTSSMVLDAMSQHIRVGLCKVMCLDAGHARRHKRDAAADAVMPSSTVRRLAHMVSPAATAQKYANLDYGAAAQHRAQAVHATQHHHHHSCGKPLNSKSPNISITRLNTCELIRLLQFLVHLDCLLDARAVWVPTENFHQSTREVPHVPHGMSLNTLLNSYCTCREHRSAEWRTSCAWDHAVHKTLTWGGNGMTHLPVDDLEAGEAGGGGHLAGHWLLKAQRAQAQRILVGHPCCRTRHSTSLHLTAAFIHERQHANLVHCTYTGRNAWLQR